MAGFAIAIERNDAGTIFGVQHEECALHGAQLSLIVVMQLTSRNAGVLSEVDHEKLACSLQNFSGLIRSKIPVRAVYWVWPFT